MTLGKPNQSTSEPSRAEKANYGEGKKALNPRKATMLKKVALESVRHCNATKRKCLHKNNDGEKFQTSRFTVLTKKNNTENG